MKKTTAIKLLAFVGIVAILLLAMTLAPNKQKGDSSVSEKFLPRQSSGLQPSLPTTADIVEKDIEKMKKLTSGEPIQTSRFMLDYDPEKNSFVVELYTGNQETETEYVHDQLRKLGIRKPENLPLYYIGPFDYKGYEPLPKEYIERMNEIYEK